MSDMTLTDMAPFFDRHERRFRRVVIALVCTSLAVAAGIFAYGALTTGSPGTILVKLWTSILFYPLFGAVFWIGSTLYARARLVPPGVRPPTNPDDARNVALVANAGFIYLLCIGVIMIATQAGLALGYFGILPPLHRSGVWITRASVVATGILVIYFGNAWSRTPMARTPEYMAVAMMRFKRLLSWLIVLYGLLMVLAALFLPQPAMAIVIAGLTILMVLSTVVSCLILNKALKSRSV